MRAKISPAQIFVVGRFKNCKISLIYFYYWTIDNSHKSKQIFSGLN